MKRFVSLTALALFAACLQTNNVEAAKKPGQTDKQFKAKQRSKNKTQDQEITAMQQDIAGLQAQLATMQSQIASQQSPVDYSGELASDESRIATLENQVSALMASSTTQSMQDALPEKPVVPTNRVSSKAMTSSPSSYSPSSRD